MQHSCGDVYAAKCALPGFSYPSCGNACEREAGHPGRCWCGFHNMFPNMLRVDGPEEEEDVNVQPPEERQIVVPDDWHNGEVCTKRSDHPHIAEGGRGNKTVAMAEMASLERRAFWIKKVKDDMYAKSSQGPRESMWKTWTMVAAQFNKEPLPLTEDLIVQAAAFFKAGRYRSVAQYFSRARQEHILTVLQGLSQGRTMLKLRLTRAVDGVA